MSEMEMGFWYLYVGKGGERGLRFPEKKIRGKETEKDREREFFFFYFGREERYAWLTRLRFIFLTR